jgi:hypothetical protein
MASALQSTHRYGRAKMKRKMSKPFRIRVNSIAARPLSFEQTARKYGASTGEVAAVRAFIAKDSVVTYTASKPRAGKSIAIRSRKSSLSGSRRSSGRRHK